MNNVELYFNHDKHQYTDLYGVPFTSCTQVNDLYCAKKDFVKIAAACEKIGRNPNHEKYLRYKDKTADQLLYEWKVITEEALDKGNEKHDYLEDTVNNATGFKKGRVNKLTGKVKLFTVADVINDNGKFKHVDTEKLEFLKIRYPAIYNTLTEYIDDGWYPYSEIGVYNERYRVSGLVDLLFVKYPYFFIVDWKTNKAPIEFKAGYYAKDNEGFLTNRFISTVEFFNDPISFLEGSTGNKYALQLSGYTFMVEQFGLQWSGNNFLYHIREVPVKEHGIYVLYEGKPVCTEEVNNVPMPYFKSEIEMIYDDHRVHRLGLKSFKL